jgi:Predicted GTPases
MEMPAMPLTRFGWDREFEAQFENHAREGFAPARVLTATRETYRLATAGGELPAELSGRLRFAAESSADLPAVGDWVAARVYPGDGLAVVDSVLPRRTALVRRSSGRRDEAQVLAANVDLLLVAAPLGGELRERRIERFLALAREADVAPAVLLTKSDLADDPAVDLAAARAVAGDAPVVVVSARTGAGLERSSPSFRRAGPPRSSALPAPESRRSSTLSSASAASRPARSANATCGAVTRRRAGSSSPSPAVRSSSTRRGFASSLSGTARRRSPRRTTRSRRAPPAVASATAATRESPAAPSGRLRTRASSTRIDSPRSRSSAARTRLSPSGALSVRPAPSASAGGE